MALPRFDLTRLRHLGGLSARLSPRQRKIARVAGYVLLGIVSFLVTLRFTFPYDRMKDKVIEALSSRYDVTIGDVGGGFLPGTIVFDRVILRSRPTKPDEKPTEIVIDELTLDLGLDFGLFGALRKKAVFDLEAELGGGAIEAEIEASSSFVEAHVETEGLALGSVPGLASAVGLPMSGSLDASIDLRLPGGKWKNAEGSIRIDCDECTVGDGVSRMTMSASPAASGRRGRRSMAAAAWGAQGVTVPRLNLGETDVVVEISKGVGQIKTFAASSKDGWLKIDGKIEFRDPFANTLFPGCMHFKLSDELKKRQPDFGNIEYTLPEKTRQEDGSFSIPTKGKLTELRWDVRRRCGGGTTEDDGSGSSPDRPSLAGGRPSLEPAIPGGVPVDPAEVPGVSGAAGAEGSDPSPPEIPPFNQGASGPALTVAPDGTMTAEGQPAAGAHDAGPPAPSSIELEPPTPPSDPRLPIDEPAQGGEVGDPPPPPPPEQGQSDRDPEDRSVD